MTVKQKQIQFRSVHDPIIVTSLKLTLYIQNKTISQKQDGDQSVNLLPIFSFLKLSLAIIAKGEGEREGRETEIIIFLFFFFSVSLFFSHYFCLRILFWFICVCKCTTETGLNCSAATDPVVYESSPAAINWASKFQVSIFLSDIGNALAKSAGVLTGM